MKQISKRLMSWASILEEQTLEQARHTASMPFIFPHLALMPDAHLGKGSTVGSVIPTLGAIIPAAVGVDIGCGMIAVRTQFTAGDARRRGDLAALREAIEGAIPLAAGNYNTSIYSAESDAPVLVFPALPEVTTLADPSKAPVLPGCRRETRSGKHLIGCARSPSFSVPNSRSSQGGRRLSDGRRD